MFSYSRFEGSYMNAHLGTKITLKTHFWYGHIKTSKYEKKMLQVQIIIQALASKRMRQNNTDKLTNNKNSTQYNIFLHTISEFPLFLPMRKLFLTYQYIQDSMLSEKFVPHRYPCEISVNNTR